VNPYEFLLSGSDESDQGVLEIAKFSQNYATYSGKLENIIQPCKNIEKFTRKTHQIKHPARGQVTQLLIRGFESRQQLAVFMGIFR
jgi:hypothetical protein